MRITRAFQLIKSLKTSELRKFMRFLTSSYHCQQPELSRLVTILLKVPSKKAHKNSLPFNTLGLYQKLYEEDEVFRSEKFRKKKVRNVLSDLTLKLETFIAIEQLEQDKMQKLHYIDRFLSSRGSQQASVLNRNKWKRQIHREPDTIRKYINRYYCYVLEFEALYNDRLKLKTSASLLEGMRLQADCIYWFAHLSYWCHQLFRSAIIQPDAQLIANVQSALQASNKFARLFKEFPTINMYRKLLKLGQKFGRMPDYLVCRDFLQNQVHKIAPGEHSTLLQFLLNYCQTSFNKGKTGFMEESFRLIEWGLKAGVISEAELSSDAFFINNAVGLIVLKRSEEDIENYKQHYSGFIPSEHRKDALNMVGAYQCFHQQDLEGAKYFLNRIKPRNHNYMVRFHSLEIRIYYQLFTTEKYLLKGLRAKIETFKKYFKNEKLPLSQEKKDSYLKLAWFVREMIHFHQPSAKGNPDHLRSLQRELQTQALPFKDWVENELNKL